MQTKTMYLASAGLIAALAGGANAANALQIDVNALTGQALDSGGNAGAFGGLTHTGSIMLSGDASSTLAGILFDGANQPIAAGQFQSFAGTINLVNGGVTGGSLMLALQNGDMFSATIVGGAGQVNVQAGQGFSIDGLLTTAQFNASTFAGVDITPWFSEQPLNGSFLNFTFGPDANGTDINTDIDIFVAIPSPLAGGLAGVGLMGLAARRRRA
jgi:hypothetical protein